MHEWRTRVWRSTAPPDAYAREARALAKRRTGTQMLALAVLGYLVSCLFVFGAFSSESPGATLLVAVTLFAGSLVAQLTGKAIRRSADRLLFQLSMEKLPEDKAFDLDRRICAEANRWLASASPDQVRDHVLDIGRSIAVEQQLRDTFSTCADEGQRASLLASMRRVLASIQLLNEHVDAGRSLEAEQLTAEREAPLLAHRQEQVAVLQAVLQQCRITYRRRFEELKSQTDLSAMPTPASLEAERPHDVTGPVMLPEDVVGIIDEILADQAAPGDARFRQGSFYLARRVKGYGAALFQMKSMLTPDQPSSKPPLDMHDVESALMGVRGTTDHEVIRQEALRKHPPLVPGAPDSRPIPMYADGS